MDWSSSITGSKRRVDTPIKQCSSQRMCYISIFISIIARVKYLPCNVYTGFCSFGIFKRDRRVCFGYAQHNIWMYMEPSLTHIITLPLNNNNNGPIISLLPDEEYPFHFTGTIYTMNNASKAKHIHTISTKTNTEALISCQGRRCRLEARGMLMHCVWLI